jgi:MFS transporter, NNP family, nitrate/nitrite transporter
MPTLACAFGVWLAWSVITSKIQLMHDKDPNVYPFQDYDSPKGKAYKSLLYTLPAVAGLSGGTLRIANSFMTPIVGGRNAVYHSSIMCSLAMILTAICLKSPTAPFNSLLVAAWLSGTGGGAFASSMANMSHFFPKRQQGYGLNFNAAFGNLGVSITQLLLGIFMSWSFGEDPVSDQVDGWPNHGTLYIKLYYSSVF